MGGHENTEYTMDVRAIIDVQYAVREIQTSELDMIVGCNIRGRVEIPLSFSSLSSNNEQGRKGELPLHFNTDVEDVMQPTYGAVHGRCTAGFPRSTIAMGRAMYRVTHGEVAIGDARCEVPL